MKSSTLKIVLSLAALFVFGGVSGVALSKNFPSATAGRPTSEDVFLQRRFRDDVERLKLTPEQAERFHASYRQLGADIRVVREETSTRVRSLFARHTEGLLPVLTPEQRQQYHQLIEERRASHRTP